MKKRINESIILAIRKDPLLYAIAFQYEKDGTLIAMYSEMLEKMVVAMEERHQKMIADRVDELNHSVIPTRFQ